MAETKRPKYFRINANNRLWIESADGKPAYVFFAGKEYLTEDVPESIIEAIAIAKCAKGANLEPAVIFYDESLVKKTAKDKENGVDG